MPTKSPLATAAVMNFLNNAFKSHVRTERLDAEIAAQLVVVF
ncbi:MAG: hypothetical protein ABJA98_01145 [Acidobacteriota bacterium]